MRDLRPYVAKDIIKEKWLEAGLDLATASDKHLEIINEVYNYGIQNLMNEFDKDTFLNNVPQEYQERIFASAKEWALNCEDKELFNLIIEKEKKITHNKQGKNIIDNFIKDVESKEADVDEDVGFKN
jgi:hypothetical protein